MISIEFIKISERVPPENVRLLFLFPQCSGVFRSQIGEYTIGCNGVRYINSGICESFYVDDEMYWSEGNESIGF